MPRFFKDEKGDIRCSCGRVFGPELFEIFTIERTPKGYILIGEARCPYCGSFLKIAKGIKVELKELKCPTCHKKDFSLEFDKIEKSLKGYRFTALLKCNSRGCDWKGTFKSGAQNILALLQGIKKITISAKGIEVQRVNKQTRQSKQLQLSESVRKRK